MKSNINEREHLLGLLRIRIDLMKKQNLSPAEIYRCLDSWMQHRQQCGNFKEQK